ncbi:hypothetical protein BK004_01320 [bacterium CG10_46_32]|nr:MAG: hypothetical protein BK004_01320 [bacterium CG10_46_32]PIR56339.1 MAG: hypothetical protein COU73_01335 [Parcubacteria group bacterium CG10_big_fil_rev_8_21_14_0_10_46_32]
MNMKKVFLINFSSQILINVANNLKANGSEIVYWQGYRDDFDHMDRSEHPETIFHHAFDAIKNISPEGVDVSEFEPVSHELVSRLYESGWQALAMMSRADHADSVFTEKRNYYYQYLKFWQGMLKRLKPDVIVFSAIPHSATSHVLYALAKLMNIETIMINQLTIETRALLMTDYQTDSAALRDEVKKHRSAKIGIDTLSLDLKTYYLNHLDPAIDSTPQYKKVYAKSKMPFAFPSVPTIIKHLYRLTFFNVARSYLTMILTKRKMSHIGPVLRGQSYKSKIKKWKKEIECVKKEYEALQQQPDLNKKFVYLPLSFQPEQTTCPRGDVFDDQLLMIDIISASLPEGWVLYIKEHAPQWYPKSIEAYQYRYQGYYERIACMKNTMLIPVTTSTFDLIERAQAIATVTGTAGWESLIRSKPVLLFGYIWYMYCDGVFQVQDATSCARAFEEICTGYRVESQKVINFLAALDLVSLKIKNYKTRFFVESDGITFDDNVRALTNGISNMINNS